MKFTVAQAVFTAALVANKVVAAPAVLGTETAPFFLQVRSDDTTINGKRLGACHIGAGIESICLEPKDIQIFTLNSTSSSPPSNLPANVAVTGNLVYNRKLIFDADSDLFELIPCSRRRALLPSYGTVPEHRLERRQRALRPRSSAVGRFLEGRGNSGLCQLRGRCS